MNNFHTILHGEKSLPDVGFLNIHMIGVQQGSYAWMVYLRNKSQHIFSGIDDTTFIAIERFHDERYLITRCSFGKIADGFNGPSPILTRIACHRAKLPYCRRDNDQVVAANEFYAFDLAFEIVNRFLSV